MTKEKLKDAAAGAIVQAAVGLLAFGALWFLTVRSDIEGHARRIETLEQAATATKAQTREDDVTGRLTRIEDAVTLIGGHLKIPGFPTLGRR